MSLRLVEYRDLNVFSLELAVWHFPKHKHTYYEMIFVDQGDGEHTVNELTLPYSQGDVFFLGPEDEHRFEIRKPSRFTFIKFTELLLVERLEGLSEKKWRGVLLQTLNNPNRPSASIVADQDEREGFFSLAALLKAEYSRSHEYNRRIVLELFGALLLYVGRSLMRRRHQPALASDRDEPMVNQISVYLRNHLLENEKISIPAVAEAFNMSPNYVSLFYKKHTGDSIQQFVIKSKLKMAQQLLSHSGQTVSEIAHRLNFTDVSHFNKVFKKYNSQTPSNFRHSVASAS